MTDPGPDKPKLAAIYTQPWMARFLLDLAGYDPSSDLAASTIIEPCVGDGSFLEPIVERLLISVTAYGRDIADCKDSIVGYDIDPEAVCATRAKVVDVLVRGGCEVATATTLSESWVRETDFLLEPAVKRARWVVGNPPYLRVEDVPKGTAKQYRANWATMRGRADVYVGFFEAGMASVVNGGVVAFLCADRWMKNQYGTDLRRLVMDRFALDVVLELVGIDVFEKRVSVYPAVTLIRAGDASDTVFARAKPGFDEAAGYRFVQRTRGKDWKAADAGFDGHLVKMKPSSKSTWAIASSEDLALVTDLESRFPDIESTGVSVHGGLATGADSVFIVSNDIDVEPEVLLPLVGPADLATGELQWAGRHLVNPWDGDELRTLAEYPRLKRYFDLHADKLKGRHIAGRAPSTWWRTIDKPAQDRWRPPKLLLADIKDRVDPVLDLDGYLPMHSLYYLKSDAWDLKVLGGLLMSATVHRFLAAHSVVMSSGAMRMSAQYLRLIRVPPYADIAPDVAERLKMAFDARDAEAATVAALQAYGIE